MTIKDRLTRGFVSGIVAGIVQDSLDYTANLANISKVKYLDWVGIILFGSKPNNLGETLLALGGEIIFSGVSGIIFAYLIIRITNKNIIFKGWLFGVTIWFTTYVIMTLFKVRGLEAMDFSTAASDLFTSSLYGILLAYTLRWLDRKTFID